MPTFLTIYTSCLLSSLCVKLCTVNAEYLFLCFLTNCYFCLVLKQFEYVEQKHLFMPKIGFHSLRRNFLSDKNWNRSGKHVALCWVNFLNCTIYYIQNVYNLKSQYCLYVTVSIFLQIWMLYANKMFIIKIFICLSVNENGNFTFKT